MALTKRRAHEDFNNDQSEKSSQSSGADLHDEVSRRENRNSMDRKWKKL